MRSCGLVTVELQARRCLQRCCWRRRYCANVFACSMRLHVLAVNSLDQISSGKSVIVILTLMMITPTEILCRESVNLHCCCSVHSLLVPHWCRCWRKQLIVSTCSVLLLLRGRSGIATLVSLLLEANHSDNARPSIASLVSVLLEANHSDNLQRVVVAWAVQHCHC